MIKLDIAFLYLQEFVVIIIDVNTTVCLWQGNVASKLIINSSTLAHVVQQCRLEMASLINMDYINEDIFNSIQNFKDF